MVLEEEETPSLNHAHVTVLKATKQRIILNTAIAILRTNIFSVSFSDLSGVVNKFFKFVPPSMKAISAIKRHKACLYPLIAAQPLKGLGGF